MTTPKRLELKSLKHSETCILIGHGYKPLPKDLLPRESVVHDITDEEKFCDCCGGNLHPMGEYISENSHSLSNNI